jgi:abortive phage resistance protein AbiGi (putative antitoxin)
MAENVSSSVLFHFTKSVENLQSILKFGFSPRYCPEYTLDPLDIKAASKRIPPMRAAPLICFCDLPLSLIRKHLSEYGNFGIGLKKQWGVKNGVTPVIYTHAKAQTRLPLLRLTAKAEAGDDKTVANDLMFLAAYTKPFVGAAWRNKKVQQKVKFYDEREWRYVPAVRGKEPLFLNREDYASSFKIDALHRRLKTKYALPIHPDDVQYLIVPEDKHILALAKYLKRLYSEDDAVLVTTAIMTIDCIHEDV